MHEGRLEVVMCHAVLRALNEGICNTCDASRLQLRLQGGAGGGAGDATARFSTREEEEEVRIISFIKHATCDSSNI